MARQTNIPTARRLIRHAITLPMSPQAKRYLELALGMMTREVTKQALRKPGNALTPARRARILEEWHRDRDRQCVEIAEAAGLGPAAGARVSEVTRGLR